MIPKLHCNLKASPGIFKVFALCVLPVLAAFYLIPFPATASGDSPIRAQITKDLNAEIVRGLELIEAGQWSRARSLLAGTGDPLAARLYYWLVFTRAYKENEADYTFGKMSSFIARNSDWPSLNTIRIRAEEVLPEHLRMQDVLVWFGENPPRTPKGMDQYIEALIFTGKGDKARQVLSDWWAGAHLNRDDQRLLYRKYHKYIGREAHKRRFDRLLFSGQTANARGIAGVLGPDYERLAAARIELARQSPGVDALIQAVPPHLQNDPGLLYERLRWRRRHDLNVGAMEILHQARTLDQIENRSQWWRERHILIRRLLEERMYKSAYLLAREHFQTGGFAFAQAEWMAGWLALRFMNKPEDALGRFVNLYENVSTPISQARAAYWAGRAAESAGHNDQAKSWYNKASQFSTTFYGQTAKVRLSGGSALNVPPVPNLSATELQGFRQNEFIRAALYLNKAGLRDEAGQMLKHFVRQNSKPEPYYFAARLALDMSQPQDAVRIAKDATKRGLFLTAQSYPVMTDYVQSIELDWALLHALMRQESLFDVRAKSPAGALGVMQVMPATAAQVAREMGIPHRRSWLTDRPAHNIKIGSRYLDQMLERFDGHYALAIAAYNAGPSRVDRWIRTFGDPRTGEVDLLDFIELMPIYETRNYVQRVLEGLYIYRFRLSDQDYKSASLQPVHMTYSPG